MPTNIKCPDCNHEFPLEEALNDELREAIEKEKQDLRQKMTDHLNKKEEEIKRLEKQFKETLHRREQEVQKEAEETLRKRISSDFEHKLQLLEQNNKENEEK